MLGRWGFGTEPVTVAPGATAIWNVFANVLFTVAAVVALALSGESHPLLTTAAWVGRAGLVVAIAAFALALHDEYNARLVGRVAQRLASWGLRLVRRGPVDGWDGWLAGFR